MWFVKMDVKDEKAIGLNQSKLQKKKKIKYYFEATNKWLGYPLVGTHWQSGLVIGRAGGCCDGLPWIHRGHRSVVLSCSDIMTMGHFESPRNTSWSILLRVRDQAPLFPHIHTLCKTGREDEGARELERSSNRERRQSWGVKCLIPLTHTLPPLFLSLLLFLSGLD